MFEDLMGSSRASERRGAFAGAVRETSLQVVRKSAFCETIETS